VSRPPLARSIGGLPVTGAQAGLIGGTGAALLLLGAALVLVSHRRTAAVAVETTSAE
jgi:hypothetical protein